MLLREFLGTLILEIGFGQNVIRRDKYRANTLTFAGDGQEDDTAGFLDVGRCEALDEVNVVLVTI